MSHPQPERGQYPPRGATTSAPVIVAAVDGSPIGERVLEVAGRLVAQTAAQVVVAHVPPILRVGSVDGEALVDLRRDLEFKVLSQAAMALDPLSVRWRLDIELGRPAAAIHEVAERNDAALIIVGSSGTGFWVTLRRLFRHSVSMHLIRHEHRPVLVVPPARSSKGDVTGRGR